MRPFAGIKAVTFDVGNTLIEPYPSVGHIYAEVAAAQGHGNISADELNQRFRASFRAHGKAVNTKSEWSVIVDETFAGLLPHPPKESFFPELYERFAQAGVWRIFDDVAPTLEALHGRGLKLGIISNWDERLRPLLKALGLADWFESIVVSCEVGASKPAAVMFETAAGELGVPAGSILHVGDSLEMDVQGAIAAGFSALQIERKAGQSSGIKSLVDLLGLI